MNCPWMVEAFDEMLLLNKGETLSPEDVRG